MPEAPRSGDVTMSTPTIDIALVGDYDPDVIAHRAIPVAIDLASKAVGVSAAGTWVHTTSLTGPPETRLARFDALWVVPASPYANTAGVLAAIRYARENGMPFLGTCGGFQHALLEYAANVWGIPHAAHAETEPMAADPVITPLACALVGTTGAIRFAEGSRMAALYGALAATEEYHCRYGLNPRFADRLETGPLRATAWDAAGEVRAVELAEHPFFVGTLFQPERAALRGEVPPAVRGLVEVMARRQRE